VLIDRGYATAKLSRSVLSGSCGWLVRRGVLPVNLVRDLTPLELDRDRTARALSMREMRSWPALLDEGELARRRDLPELARFMFATGLRLGEAPGVTWADVDLATGAIAVHRTIVRVRGQGLVAKRVKSRASERGLLLPAWCVELVRARRVRLGAFEGPVFPDSRGGWRDRSNVKKAFRAVHGGSDFEWVKTHTFRTTVATLLDQSGASARLIADQLGHSRLSMTQDVNLGRRAGNAANLAALPAYDPDVASPDRSGDDHR
jgi:integrase